MLFCVFHVQTILIQFDCFVYTEFEGVQRLWQLRTCGIAITPHTDVPITIGTGRGVAAKSTFATQIEFLKLVNTCTLRTNENYHTRK